MYVDAIFDKVHNVVKVVERINGNRLFTNYTVEHTFYYDSKKGIYKNIFGNPVAKFSTTSRKKFNNELLTVRRSNKNTYESDINPVNRCLEKNYLGVDPPKLHIAFFDIEVAFDPIKGYSDPDDPFSEVTAISLHLTSINKTIALVLKPKNIDENIAKEIVEKFDNNVFLYLDESKLLSDFLNLIEDSDVLSGWNSSYYDIPYLVNRITKVLGSDFTRKLCLWDEKPRKKSTLFFGTNRNSYSLVGRVHLDYLELYKKHSKQELHSYKLDYVGEIEVKEKKVEYEGSLDQLYKKDFKKFIEYSLQDADLLVKIDKKNQYIELANVIAHTNTITIPSTMGTVRLVEQAIINEAHSKKLVVPDKKEYSSALPVAGAYVADPKKGMHEFIGALDINSLYPSCLRSLNMSNETLVAQIDSVFTKNNIDDKIEKGLVGSDVWHDMFGTLEFNYIKDELDSPLLTLKFEDGRTKVDTPKNIKKWIWERQLSLSANGTLFRTDISGIIPVILEKWYSERKIMKKYMIDAKIISEGVLITDYLKNNLIFKNIEDSNVNEINLSILKKLIKSNNIIKLQKYIEECGIKCIGNKLAPINLEKYRELVKFWDKRQYTRKILLNALYGSLLNPHCRFYDPRLGQSVTLTGRVVVKNLIETTNQLITSSKDINGEAIIYGDTDSVYFSAAPLLKNIDDKEKFDWTKESFIKLYNNIGKQVNLLFPKFMMDTFNVNSNSSGIIQSSRESVSSRGIFLKKKRYALMVYDEDNFRLDKLSKVESEKRSYVYKFGRIKAMGVETKRTDTSKDIQKFLTNLLTMVLCGKEEKEVLEYISIFRDDFRKWEGWEKGTPKTVKNISKYFELYNSESKINVTIPGHVRAALNWNVLKKEFNDNYSIYIKNGQKVSVCKLVSGPININSIAYPIDQIHLPKWFTSLPFDHNFMEEGSIDKKVKNLIGVLNWDLSKSNNDSTFSDFFEL